jgi:predicted MPP superfamily phosphohydrolase
VIEAKDFSDREIFPGQTGNLFDVLLHKTMALDEIPSALFFFLMVALSFLGYLANGLFCLIFLVFILFDWISISLLPKFHRSYGPVKPQVFFLALFRILPVLFTAPIIWIPLQILGCILQIYAFWFEPYRISVTRQKIETNKLPPASRFAILHIGDLHLERLSIREEKLNGLIRDISPDAILFSGDYLSLSSIRNPQAWSDLKAVLREWRAPLGIFGVSGSPAVDLPENFPHLLDETPVRLLNDAVVFLDGNGGTLQVIGLECTHAPHKDAPRLNELLKTTPSGFRILLHHSPDIAPLITDGQVDLQLSGHTHGGQVCLPLTGPLFTGSLYGLKFQSGRYSLGKLVLYIIRGLGLEGLSAPRVRFLCPPEIVVWEITGINHKDAK